MNFKKSKGITLIALVITIIVLLILAGVSIAALTGESGILKKAQIAAKETSKANAVEQVQIEAMGSFNRSGEFDKEQFKENLKNNLGVKDEDIVENADGSITVTIDGWEVTVDIDGAVTEVIEVGQKPVENYPQINVGDNATENSTINGKKPSYNNPVIPKGFKAINEGNANWNEANGYNNGLVIEDVSAGDSTTVGNQFVWIPVENYDNFHLIEGYSNKQLQTRLSQSTNPSREAGSSKEEILPGKPNPANTVLGTDESVAMYASVKKNGGFYIARYEAGIEGTKDNYSLSTKKPVDGSVKPLSKKGVGVWNSIPWSTSASNSPNDKLPGDDTKNGTVKVSRNLYNDKSKTTATSTLCYGVQWDAVMNFLDPNYLEGKCDVENSIVANGAGKGNYSKQLTTTGYYQEKNIYDLAGNVYEWTMEAYGTDRRVNRGGSYNVDATYTPASTRNIDLPDSSSNNIAFRPALYV